jgi:hypothetical protein
MPRVALRFLQSPLQVVKQPELADEYRILSTASAATEDLN